MNIPVYVSATVPGDKTAVADKLQAWERIYRNASFVWIDFEEHIDTSRWTSKPRAKPFMVTHYYRSRAGVLCSYELGGCKTLEKALEKAAAFAERMATA